MPLNTNSREWAGCFREREHTDMGIDADVEQKVGNTLTSQHIALQIKSGQSYLKENKNGKIYFYIDSWHYKYWLQSDRPVLILFYDDILDRVIWEQVCLTHLNRVSESKTRITITPSRVSVYFSNPLIFSGYLGGFD